MSHSFTFFHSGKLKREEFRQDDLGIRTRRPFEIARPMPQDDCQLQGSETALGLQAFGIRIPMGVTRP